MVNIFVSYAKEDVACAESIRQELEVKGYSVWREPPALSLKSILYARTLDNAIIGSAALVLIWSSGAAQSEWVEHHLLLAQRLRKPIFPVQVDGTDLPATLIVDTIVSGRPPCADVAISLLAMPGFPSSQSADPLITLWEVASHDSLNSIRTRKKAIEQAAAMLNQPEPARREATLALLEYLAQHDLMPGIRSKASAVLEEDEKKVAQVPPPSFLRPVDSRHMFAVRCKKCQHLNYFDKRRECIGEKGKVREIVERGGSRLHRLALKCEECGEEMPVDIDCEGYV